MTEEERLDMLREAIALLGKVYQSIVHAPALTLARESEVKKSPKIGFYPLRSIGEPLSGKSVIAN